MRYAAWVELVFRAVGTVGVTRAGSLSSIAEKLGVAGLTWDDFVMRDGVAGALYVAMEDLAETGLIEFENVDWGIGLTPEGRDVLAAGLESSWPQIRAIPTSETERAFLARLIGASLVDGGRWAGLQFDDIDSIYAQLGLTSGDARDADLERRTFLGDLERKGLAKRESGTAGSANRYRPTYRSVVIVEEVHDSREASREQTPRHHRGRPRGSYVLTTSDIEETYRSLWQQSGRRPTWTDIARVRGVDERTLRKARDEFGITHQTFAAKPE